MKCPNCGLENEHAIFCGLRDSFKFETNQPTDAGDRCCPKCKWCGLPVYGFHMWDTFICGTGQGVLDGQSPACREICRLTAELSRLREELTQAEKRIELAGGYHQRTPREIEIEESLNETPEDERDSPDMAIAELLELVDAGRNRVHEEIEKQERLRELFQLTEQWRQRAIDASIEAHRIRRTVKAPTEAEDRCITRAEVYVMCADEALAALDHPAPQKPETEDADIRNV